MVYNDKIEQESGLIKILVPKEKDFLVVQKLESTCQEQEWVQMGLEETADKVLVDFATPWAVAHQALLSMGFSKQGYWSGLSFPSPEDLPHPGTEPASLISPLPLVPSGKP